MDFLRKLDEAVDSLAYFMGYRTLPALNVVEHTVRNGLDVGRHTDTYWSWQPLLYIYHPGPEHGRKYSNLVEVRFRKDDPGLCGFSDNGTAYQYITFKDIPARTAAVVDHWPANIKTELDRLRKLVVNDSRYQHDWTFAGLLPNDLRPAVADGLRSIAASIPLREQYLEHEFGYVGPITRFDDPSDTSITGIFLIEYSLKHGYRSWIDETTTVKVLFASPTSSLNNRLQHDGA
jgi:hypothetical protein